MAKQATQKLKATLDIQARFEPGQIVLSGHGTRQISQMLKREGFEFSSPSGEWVMGGDRHKAHLVKTGGKNLLPASLKDMIEDPQNRGKFVGTVSDILTNGGGGGNPNDTADYEGESEKGADDGANGERSGGSPFGAPPTGGDSSVPSGSSGAGMGSMEGSDQADGQMGDQSGQGDTQSAGNNPGKGNGDGQQVESDSPSGNSDGSGGSEDSDLDEDALNQALADAASEDGEDSEDGNPGDDPGDDPDDDPNDLDSSANPEQDAAQDEDSDLNSNEGGLNNDSDSADGANNETEADDFDDWGDFDDEELEAEIALDAELDDEDLDGDKFDEYPENGDIPDQQSNNNNNNDNNGIDDDIEGLDEILAALGVDDNAGNNAPEQTEQKQDSPQQPQPNDQPGQEENQDGDQTKQAEADQEATDQNGAQDAEQDQAPEDQTPPPPENQSAEPPKPEPKPPPKVEVPKQPEHKVGEPLPPNLRNALSPDFIPPSWFPRLIWEIADARKVAIYVVGPSGNGKTTAAEEVFKHLGIPYLTVDGNPDTSSRSLVGGPNRMGKDKSGNWYQQWVNGTITEAFIKGYGVIIDEGDAIRSGVLLNLQRAFQMNSRYIHLPEVHKRISPAALCPIIINANTTGSGATRSYVGRETLDQASLNRFTVIPTGYENEEKILDLQGCVPAAISRRIVSWATKQREKIDENELPLVLSTRNLKNIAQYYKFLVDTKHPNPFEEAINLDWWGRLSKEDREALED